MRHNQVATSYQADFATTIPNFLVANFESDSISSSSLCRCLEERKRQIHSASLSEEGGIKRVQEDPRREDSHQSYYKIDNKHDDDSITKISNIKLMSQLQFYCFSTISFPNFSFHITP